MQFLMIAARPWRRQAHAIVRSLRVTALRAPMLASLCLGIPLSEGHAQTDGLTRGDSTAQVDTLEALHPAHPGSSAAPENTVTSGSVATPGSTAVTRKTAGAGSAAVSARLPAPPASGDPAAALAQARRLVVVDGAETFKQHDLDVPLPTRVRLNYGDQSWNLKLLGSGLRKKMVFKVYVAVLYVDSTAVLGDDPAEAVCQQDIARRMVIVVKRDLDASRIADAISRGFIENVWKAPPDSMLAKCLDEYIAFFGGRVKEGQRLDVTYLPGHGMFTSVSGEPRPIITEPRLAQGIWSIWLGKTPISEDLRDRLVERVAVDSGSH